MSADNVSQNWSLSALQLFASDDCSGEPMDLSSAKAMSSSPTPADFADCPGALPLESSDEGSSGDESSSGDTAACSVWRSGVSAEPYIGWSFPEAVDVGCFLAVSPPGVLNSCTFDWSCFGYVNATCSLDSCDSCCNSDYSDRAYAVDAVFLQAQRQDGSWRTVRRSSYDDAPLSYSPPPSRMSSHPLSVEEERTTNSAYTALLVTVIVFAILGGILLLVALPIAAWHHQRATAGVRELQGELDAGRAGEWRAEDAQWAAWVERTWGRAGRVRKAEAGPLVIATSCIAAAAASTLLFKLKAIANDDDDISWLLAVETMCPTAVTLVLLLFGLRRLQVRLRYRKLQRCKHPLVLGPRSVYFAGVLLRNRGRVFVTSTSFFADAVAEGGFIFQVQYLVRQKNTNKKVTLTAPLRAGDAAAAKAFVLRHCDFYKLLVSSAGASPIAVATGTAVTQPTAANHVVNVAPQEAHRRELLEGVEGA